MKYDKEKLENIISKFINKPQVVKSIISSNDLIQLSIFLLNDDANNSIIYNKDNFNLVFELLVKILDNFNILVNNDICNSQELLILIDACGKKMSNPPIVKSGNLIINESIESIKPTPIKVNTEPIISPFVYDTSTSR